MCNGNLAEDSQHQAAFEELKERLAKWRKETRDPLLNPENLKRLKAEIDACVEDGKPQKSKLVLNYPDYFP